jgi:hypothetical protein
MNPPLVGAPPVADVAPVDTGGLISGWTVRVTWLVAFVSAVLICPTGERDEDGGGAGAGKGVDAGAGAGALGSSRPDPPPKAERTALPYDPDGGGAAAMGPRGGMVGGLEGGGPSIVITGSLIGCTIPEKMLRSSLYSFRCAGGGAGAGLEYVGAPVGARAGDGGGTGAAGVAGCHPDGPGSTGSPADTQPPATMGDAGAGDPGGGTVASGGPCVPGGGEGGGGAPGSL